MSISALAALMAVGCTGSANKQTVFDLRDAPAEFADAIARADEAIQAVRRQHGSLMNKAMHDGGVEEAIGVCSKEARAITAKLSEGSGLKIGRTSPRLRNPANQPPPWLATFVAGLDGKRASEVKAQVFDLGEQIGVVRPIPTAKVCTRCHGKPAELDQTATAPLREAYPQDRATGFAVGDVRGVFWVEVAKKGS